MDDRKWLDDQVLTWVRTIFKSLNFTPKFLRDSYTLLREAVRAKTKPRTYRADGAVPHAHDRST